jgi:type II secretory pathway component PulK
MNDRGFALLAVLWVLTALTALTSAGMIVARVGGQTTRNRVLLARAEWAREACGEILKARFARNPAIRALDSIDLGRGTWCRASLGDPAAQLNLNSARRDELEQLVVTIRIPRGIADSIIAQRRQGMIHDIRQVRGLDSAELHRLAQLLTTRGTGVVNVNAAHPEVLRLLPGMTEEAVRLILNRRSNRPLQSADELAAALSRSTRELLLRSYPEFIRSSVFTPQQLIAVLEGGVRGSSIVTRATLTTVPVSGRLAVIRRETE